MCPDHDDVRRAKQAMLSYYRLSPSPVTILRNSAPLSWRGFRFKSLGPHPLVSYQRIYGLKPHMYIENNTHSKTLAVISKCADIQQSTRSYSTEPDRLPQDTHDDQQRADHHEKIITIPNMLTFVRILGSPYIGYLIVQQQYELALAGCVLFGITDALDGYIARKFDMGSFVGSIIDPAADKLLMTVLTISLSISDLLPVPLAVIIVGRDVLLSLAAFYIRWITLPAPKTFSRYWDLSLPSVEVRPTIISKYNTAFQLILMGTTLTVPVFGLSIDHWSILGLQIITGFTTIASGIGYLVSRDAVHMLTKADISKRIKKSGNKLRNPKK